jgi:hypothetical protein
VHQEPVNDVGFDLAEELNEAPELASDGPRVARRPKSAQAEHAHRHAGITERPFERPAARERTDVRSKPRAIEASRQAHQLAFCSTAIERADDVTDTEWLRHGNTEKRGNMEKRGNTE